MRVLAFGAHPDDIDIKLGGTLALYAQQGHEIYMCIATNGNIGSMRLSKEEIAETRKKEAQAAADVIGAHLIWLGYDDEYLFDNEETRNAFIDVVRIARPDIIFAPPYGKSYNPDHDITGYLAFIARINASIKLIETEHPHTEKIPPMFYWRESGQLFDLDYFVDVTPVYDTKIKMMECHRSQMEEWGDEFFGNNMKQSSMKRDAANAADCGINGYVEGFSICKTYPIVPNSYKLLP